MESGQCTISLAEYERLRATEKEFRDLKKSLAKNAPRHFYYRESDKNQQLGNHKVEEANSGIESEKMV